MFFWFEFVVGRDLNDPEKGREERERNKTQNDPIFTSLSGEKERIPLMRSCGWGKDGGRKRRRGL